MLGATSKMKGDKMGDTGVIIQGDDSAERCFVLMDLIPMKTFSNKSWLWNWKCAPQAKFLVKKLLEIRFSSMWFSIKGGMGRGRPQFFGGEWHPTEGCGSKFWVWVGRALSWSSIKNILRSALGLKTVTTLKRVCEIVYFISKQQIYSIKG